MNLREEVLKVRSEAINKEKENERNKRLYEERVRMATRILNSVIKPKFLELAKQTHKELRVTYQINSTEENAPEEVWKSICEPEGIDLRYQNLDVWYPRLEFKISND